jgi:hypothetical protein
MNARTICAHGRHIQVTTITPEDRPRRKRVFVQFPAGWIIRLAEAPASVWVVASQLLYLNFKNRGKPHKLTNQPIEALGLKIPPRSKWRALAVLEGAHLVSIERRGNKSPIITLHLEP